MLLHTRMLATTFFFTAISSVFACTQFTNTVSLGSGIGTIEYGVTSSSISMRFNSTAKAWLGIGISQVGGMVGSSAVIGLPGTGSVGKYKLLGQVAGEIVLSSSTFISKQVTQSNGGTVLAFSNNLNDPNFLTTGSGSVTFIWAIGSSNTLVSHINRGSFTVSLTPCVTKKPSRKPSRKPTKKPTRKPTKKPTRKPSRKPTRKPSKKPTRKPSKKPTRKPSKKPTRKPTKKPTRRPA